MGTGGLQNVLGHLRQALLPSGGGGLSDAQLLGRFLDGRDEAAFAALVRRHGPMVLGVCRRILGHAQDAEDAFQATFLVLARKAASVARREALPSFLYGVAYRTAVRAKARAARRRATERQVEEMPHPEATPVEVQDWRPLLDRELDLLPKKYQAPVILCDLEGKTRREVARQLGLSEGTLSSQLTRGRRLLAKRLSRHGLSLSGGALAAALSEAAASAVVPAPLVVSTVQAAVCVAAGPAAGLTTPAAVLMNEVLKAMLMTKLKFAVTAVMVTVMLGAGGLVYNAAGQSEGKPSGRPRTEVEALRHENELLKFNLEVVLEKCRAQEAELHTLRGRVATPPGTGAATGGHGVSSSEGAAPTGTSAPPKSPFGGAGGTSRGDSTGYGAGQGTGLGAGKGVGIGFTRPAPTHARHGIASESTASADQEVEAALKAFREARDDTAKRRAAEKLEVALKNLRQHLRPADSTPPK